MVTLPETAILLTAAVIAVSLFRLLRLSSILGYVAAGLAIGPWGLNLIGDVGSLSQVSEFGVVLLLFIIGLELQPHAAVGDAPQRVRPGLRAGPAVRGCPGRARPGRWGSRRSPRRIIGFGLSLSSTPLVLQVLAERGQLKTQHGRAAFGILLFQDLAVLPVLAVLPLLVPHDAAGAARRLGRGSC